MKLPASDVCNRLFSRFKHSIVLFCNKARFRVLQKILPVKAFQDRSRYLTEVFNLSPFIKGIIDSNEEFNILFNSKINLI